jgi:SagB-type dehydrogenase family enzyme
MESHAWHVLNYHEQTKHHFHRYARSLGYLNWDNQPRPFRVYEGVTPVLLPLLKSDPEGRHLDLYERSRNHVWDFNPASIGAFLELSLGLSAWKSIPEGNRWALRMNPSSGNLHPTEAHLILPALDGPVRYQAVTGTRVESGVYHYTAYSHALEPRALLPADYGQRIRSHFQSPGFLIGLTSIAWREAWKYGERALRYCHHDAGHALAALSFAGNLLGWKVTVLNAISTEDVSVMLGFPQMTWPPLEEERPDMLCFVSPSPQKAIPRMLPVDLLGAFKQLHFEGTPSRLSEDPVEWPLIRETEPLIEKPVTPETSIRFAVPPVTRGPECTLPAAQIIRQRRSAVAYDGRTSITSAQFLSMLDKTLPRNSMAPFDAELGLPLVHLALFVHQVEGVESGLYFLLRNPEHLKDLKRSLQRGFAWTPVAGELPLYLLKNGDYREKAKEVSCGQSIAGASAFSLGMLAHFAPVIERAPWRYPHLFWETGMIGQALYLEAEAQGVRATGIGCFFDDPVHELLGLRDNAYQSLYHFTVGGAVEDHRLETHPPYAHLPADRR